MQEPTSSSAPADRKPAAKRGAVRFTIIVNGGREQKLRSEAQVGAAIDRLNVKDRGFFAINKANGDYAQCGGGYGQYTVESRDWLDEYYQTFQHFVAG